MKYIKFITLNIFIFGSLFFGMSILFPSQNNFSKSIEVAATKNKIENYIILTENWKVWNLLLLNNTSINQNISDSVGLHFNNGDNHFKFFINAIDSNSVVVNSVFSENLPWYKPLKKFKAMVLNKQVAAALETSLNNLKATIETEN